MKWIFLFLILNLLAACTNSEPASNFTVTTYLKVGYGEQYSDNVLEHGGTAYRPLATVHYTDEKMVAVETYQPEVERNGSLPQRLPFPEVLRIKVESRAVMVNQRPYPIDKRTGDSLFYKRGDSLFLYTKTSF